MDDLYDRLIELLGRPPDEPAWERLLCELGQTEQMVHQSRRMQVHMFPALGFDVTLDKRQGQIKHLTLHIATAMVQAGSGNCFSGRLPFGITAADDRNAVERKLGMSPKVSNLVQGRTPDEPKDRWEKYDLSPLEMTIIFSGATNEVSLIGLHYTIDVVPAEPPPPEPSTYLETRTTTAARRVIELAREESRRMEQSFLGSEQILLGLIAEGDGVAARALDLSGIGLESARAEVHKIVGIGGRAVGSGLEFTPAAKHALAKSLKIVDELGDDLIDTEHLLLGLLDEGQGVGIRVMENLGINFDELRARILALQKEKQ